MHLITYLFTYLFTNFFIYLLIHFFINLLFINLFFICNYYDQVKEQLKKLFPIKEKKKSLN